MVEFIQALFTVNGSRVVEFGEKGQMDGQCSASKRVMCDLTNVQVQRDFTKGTYYLSETKLSDNTYYILIVIWLFILFIQTVIPIGIMTWVIAKVQTICNI